MLFANHVGCGQCWSIDGNWKLIFPHCMYPVKMKIPGLEGINTPDVCFNQPEASNTPFCSTHKRLAMQKQIPTDMKGFMKYCNGSALGMCIYVCLICMCMCMYVCISIHKHASFQGSHLLTHLTHKVICMLPSSIYGTQVIYVPII